MANGKEFFLKRWMRSLVEWLDEKLFETAEPAEKPTFKLLSNVFTVTFFAGLVIGVCAMFSDGSNTPLVTILASALSVCVLVFYVLFLLKDIKRFETVGRKIWRGVYLFLLCSITGSVAAFIAAAAIFVVVVLLVLYLLFVILLGGGSSSGSKKRIKLDNGDEVKEEKGMLGESYYTGLSGTQYEKVSEDTYVEK